jgi:hypothetical protein
MQRQRHPGLRKFLIGAGVAIIGVAILITVLIFRLSPISQRWAVRALGNYYNSYVTLETFHVTLYPNIVASGSGLLLRDRAHPSGPPLASIRQFSLQATWRGLLQHPRHVHHVHLEGLTLNVPPRQPPGGQITRKKHHLPPLYFGDVDADGTVLNTFSHDPGRPPRVFAISKLRLQSVGVGKAMAFQATLTNPKPIGEIQTSGEFGPWNPDEPGQTPVVGQYDFRDADLSTIRGIAGTLSSEGKFTGVLDRIEVDGITNTPNFALGAGSRSEPLNTQFHAVVDGTTGQTLLQPVRAELRHSLIIASGGVFRAANVKGTTILLNVTADGARLGDLLGLVVKSYEPPMNGAISVQTEFEVLPGSEDVERRLRLNGKFSIDTATFTDPEVEEKITHLSQRGEGKPSEIDAQSVASNFKGRFVLSQAVMSFSNLSFDVPGASVDLHGTYGLPDENLNFLGTLKLRAEISQTTTGVKSFLLRFVDPVFKGKDAGTVVPIRISGDRRHPAFGVQYRSLLKRFGM